MITGASIWNMRITRQLQVHRASSQLGLLKKETRRVRTPSSPAPGASSTRRPAATNRSARRDLNTVHKSSCTNDPERDEGADAVVGLRCHKRAEIRRGERDVSKACQTAHVGNSSRTCQNVNICPRTCSRETSAMYVDPMGRATPCPSPTMKRPP